MQKPVTPDAVAVDVGVGNKEVHRRVHVGDDVRVVQVIEPLQAWAVQLFLRVAVEQVRHHGHIAGLGQPVGHHLVELVQPADMEGDDDGGVGRSAAAGNRRVHIHFRAVDCELVCKRGHIKLSLYWLR